MYDALTITNSPWGERVLATIDACIDDQHGDKHVARVVDALSRVSSWPGCPRAADLSPATTPPFYRRIPLSSDMTRHYEALLIVWPPSYATPVHDHDGLWGMEFVLDGVLKVESFQLATRPIIHLEPRHTLIAGIGDHVAFSDADYAHRCRNLSRNRQALTLHVYGGALDTYRSFQQEEEGWSSTLHRAMRETIPA